MDITPAVVETPERRGFMLFEGPIVALPSVFVMQVGSKRYVDGFASLSGLRMALVKNGPVTLRVEREFPGIIPVYVDNTVEALAAVASGNADVAVSNINFITREIESKYLGTLKIAPSDLGYVLETLARLRIRGFDISIDDYGTGFSSMQQLSRIPFTELKIDQSFVTGATNRPNMRVILESSLQLSQKLGLRSVAEGVEKEEEWALLKSLGCDVAQG